MWGLVKGLGGGGGTDVEIGGHWFSSERVTTHWLGVETDFNRVLSLMAGLSLKYPVDEDVL